MTVTEDEIRRVFRAMRRVYGHAGMDLNVYRDDDTGEQVVTFATWHETSAVRGNLDDLVRVVTDVDDG